MKFGGTSVADAERILAVAEIVRSRLGRRPVVVLSALAGVTDLLVRAISQARGGDREGLEASVGELERRHRWALAGTLQDSRRRHDLDLEINAIFDDLRQLLRSVRILGEGTPRASDTLLAFGETLSTRIAWACFVERGMPASWIDPRRVMVTDSRHGAAEPDLDAVAARSRETIVPALEAGQVPIIGGFVGASLEGETTTLGRGGSDTSAAILGAALEAEEIEIWTDVDGLMTADPRWVPGARRLPALSFPEAAELAFYGARVLHPASIAPAVKRAIPVRVLNSLRPEGEGTLILDAVEDAPPLASVACRRGVCAARVTGRSMRMDPGFLPSVLAVFDRMGLVPDLVVSSEVAVTLVLREEASLEAVTGALAPRAAVQRIPDLAIVCVVGAGLDREPAIRRKVISAMADLEPELVALGGSATSVAVVIGEARLESAVREIHDKFFG